LFDYLGHAAGSDLGKQVAAAASAEKVRIAVKYVQNSKYKGDILMYPIDWLDYYFSKKETKQDESDELYELPF
jgi:hypothetical protein